MEPNENSELLETRTENVKTHEYLFVKMHSMKISSTYLAPLSRNVFFTVGKKIDKLPERKCGSFFRINDNLIFFRIIQIFSLRQPSF